MFFLACDTETTGLYPEQGDEILEIALAIIDRTFRIVGPVFSTIVQPTAKGVERLRANEKVLAMHTKSGLLAALGEGKSAVTPYGRMPIAEGADQCAVEWFTKNFPAGADRPPLLGANPSFDRRFLEAYLPKLACKLHYRSFETNTFWLADSALGLNPPDKVDTAHRAEADLHASLQAIHDHYNRMAAAFRAGAK